MPTRSLVPTGPLRAVRRAFARRLPLRRLASLRADDGMSTVEYAKACKGACGVRK